MLRVERSPAKVCWHVMYNDVLLGTTDTRAEANALCETFRMKYGNLIA